LFYTAASLVDRYKEAAETSQKFQMYYEKMVQGISNEDLVEWEEKIQTAESARMRDRSVMDILGAKEIEVEVSAASQQSDPNLEHGSVAEWIKLALDIEELQ
jgi:hypothetical protein